MNRILAHQAMGEKRHSANQGKADFVEAIKNRLELAQTDKDELLPREEAERMAKMVLSWARNDENLQKNPEIWEAFRQGVKPTDTTYGKLVDVNKPDYLGLAEQRSNKIVALGEELMRAAQGVLTAEDTELLLGYLEDAKTKLLGPRKEGEHGQDD